MENSYLNNMLKAARFKQARHRMVALFSVLVLILTTNQLKLKADTLERRATCGSVEHQHSEECLDEAGTIVCGLEEHVHTDACFQERPKADEVMPEVALPIEDGVLELGDDAFVVSSEIETPPEESDGFELGELEEPAPENDVEGETAAVESFVTPIYDFEGASYALLSDILAGTGIDIDKNAIDEVGESVIDDDQQLSISVVKDGDEYTITALRDFIDDDMVELVVFTKDGGVYLVNLKNGIAYEPAEAAVDEEQPVPVEPAPVDDEDQTSAATIDDEDTAEEQPVPAESAPVDDEEQAAVEATEQPSASVEDEASEPVIEQTDSEAEATAAPTATPAPDPEPADEQSAADITSTATAEPINEGITENRETEDLPQKAVEDEEQPGEAVEGEEQPGEAAEDEEQPEKAVGDEGEEKPEESVTEGEGQSEGSVGDETEEQPDETPVVVYTATVDLTDRAVPFSLEEMMGAAAPAEDLSAQEEQQAEEALDPSDWTLEYDEELLEVVFEDGDYLITPKASFEAATIRIEAGDSYVLNLMNYRMPVPYPAQSFEGITATMTVKVTADEGAFPEGTTMEVVDVEDEATISDIAGAVEGENVTVNRVHAVDITFRNAEGEEIEPLIPISVVMEVNEQTQSADAVVVHVDGEGNAEVLEQTGEGNAVAFDSEAFSVYAVVITEKYISASGESYNIQVSYNSEAGIPDGAALRVLEVEDQEYIDKVSDALDEGRAVRLARFFDISIMDGNREIQPDGAVTVKVTLEDAVEADEVKAVHFGDEVTVLDVVEDAGTLSFQAESFSVYGIVYTVDFEYDGETHSIMGESSIRLSRLFEKLNICEDLTASTAVFSNPALLDVSPVTEGDVVTDWLLTSLLPFQTHETLTVTLADGRVCVLNVTDAVAQTGGSVTILNPNIGITLISGAEPEDGNWVWTEHQTETEGHAFTFRADYSFSTYTTQKTQWEKDQIEIRIPLHILKDRNGEYADRLEMSIPEASMEDQLNDTHVFVFKKVETAEDGLKPGEEPYVLIYNRIPADPTQVGYFEVAYKTTEKTFEYTDYDPEHPNQLPPEWMTLTIYDEKVTYDSGTGTTTVVADKDADPLLHKASDEIFVNIDTAAEVTSTVKRAPSAPYQQQGWNESWGTAPTDAGVYYYAVWTVESNIVATQPYDFTLTDSFKPGNGEVVGYRLTGDTVFTACENGTVTLENQKVNYGNSIRRDYVLTRISKDEYDAILERDGSYIINNEITATVTPRDGFDARSAKTGKAHYQVEKPHYTVAGAGFNGEKKGLTSRFDLTRFMTENTYTSIPNLQYYTWVDANVWPYTYQDAEAADEEKQIEENHGKYGKTPVTVEITDKTLWLKYFDQSAWATAGSSGTQDEFTAVSPQLQRDDYRFTGLTIGYSFADGKYREHEGFTRVGQKDSELAALAEAGRLGELVLEIYLNGSDTPVEGQAKYSFADRTWTIDPALDAYIASAEGMNVTFRDADITGYRLSNANALYSTKLEAWPVVSMKKGSIVSEVLRKIDPEAPSIDLWNRAEHRVYQGTINCYVYSRDGVDHIIGDIRNSVINKGYSEPENDVIGARYLISWNVDMAETYSINNSVTEVTQNGGVFYDLLPTGVEYLPGTVQVYGDDQESLNKSEYRVDLVSNYNGSGRVMMIVTIDAPADRYRMTYDTAITWDAILQQRNTNSNVVTLHNAVAYETGNEDIGRFDKSYMYKKDSDLAAHPSDGKLYDRVDTEEKGPRKVIMTVKDCPVGTLVAGTLGLQKTVKATVNSHGYGKTAVTYPEGEYSYRLQFGPNAGSMAKGLILYDFMESFRDSGIQSQWYGRVRSVDTSLVEGMGATPEVYYSTVDRDAMYNWLADNGKTVQDLASLDAKIGDVDFWTKAVDSDLSALNVTAIAVDLRKGTEVVQTVNADNQTVETYNEFVLHGGRTASVYVYLNAPSAAETPSHEDDDSFIAYNDVYLNHAITGEGKAFVDNGQVIKQGETEITYRVVGDLRIRKVDIETEKPIEGITFHLTGTSNYGASVDETRKTTSTGSLIFDSLEKGTYTLWEESGSKDYQLDSDTKLTVTITDQGTAEITGFEELPDLDENPDAEMPKLTGKMITVTGEGSSTVLWQITNKPREWADFEFTKVGDVDGQTVAKALAGATFKLSGKSDYDNDIELYSTSDTLGRVAFEDVEAGTYTLEEYVEADGYVRANRKFRVTVDENNKVAIALDGPVNEETDNVEFIESRTKPSEDSDYEEITWTIKDEVKHNLSLLKVDAVNNRVLSGAQFRLTGTSDYGTPVDITATSQASGAVDFRGLEPGAYVLQEIAAPEHHELDETLYTVTIERDGKITISWNGNTIDNTVEEAGEPRIIPAGSTYGEKTDRESPANRFFYKYYARFSMPNARVEQGVITIKKTWWDEATNGSPTRITATTGLPAPVIHAKTEVPIEPTRPARIDRNKWDSFFNGLDLATVTAFENQAEAPEDLSGWTLVSESQGDFPKNIYLKQDSDGAILWYADTVEAYLPVNSRDLFNKNVSNKRLTNMKTVSLVGENVSLRANYTDSMTSMFENCSGLTSVTFPSNFGTENVTAAYGQGGMNAMFFKCNNLTEVDLSAFDFRNVTSMHNMFSNCYQIQKITLPASADTSRVSNMACMFQNCNNLAVIDNLSALDTANVTNMNHMFAGCQKLGRTADGGLDLSSFNTSNVTDMNYIFEDVGRYWYDKKIDSTTITLTGLDTSNVRNMEGMFNRCWGLETLDVSQLNTSSCTNMKLMFGYCLTLQALDLSSFNTGNVTNMYQMFESCKAIKTLDVSGFDTSKVTTMYEMFHQCNEVESIEGLHKFNTGACTSIFDMFSECWKLKSVDVTSFDTANMSTISYVFNNCRALEVLDLSSFDTSKTTTMRHLFQGCSNLEKIYVDPAKWSTVSVVASVSNNTLNIFGFCNKLVGGAGTSYANNNTHGSDLSYARIDGGASAPGFLTNIADKPAANTASTHSTRFAASRRAATVSVSISGVIDGEMPQETPVYDDGVEMVAEPVFAAYDAAVQPEPEATADYDENDIEIITDDAEDLAGLSEPMLMAAEPVEGDTDGADDADGADDETSDDPAVTETPETVETTAIDKVTNGVTYVGADDGTLFDTWIIDPNTGEWTYRFHVYEEVDEDGEPVTMTYYIFEEEKIDGVEYLAPFTWFNQDSGVWYKTLEYTKGTAGPVEIQNKKPHSETPRGGLSVTKVVNDPTGSTYVEGQKFNFTINYVKSDGTPVNGESFSLTAGDTKTWTDLQVGSQYSIEETVGAQYQVSFDQQSGQISGDGMVRVVATNTVKVPRTGKLEISKAVLYAEDATEGDDPEFSFAITLADGDNNPLSGVYSGRLGDGSAQPVQFVNGFARVSIHAGDDLTISGLPEGAKYTVTEDATENYSLVSRSGDTGSIIADQTQTAAFTNEKKKDAEYGGFTLVKRLGEGTVLDDPGMAFSFTIEMTGLKPFATYTYKTGTAVETATERSFKADKDGAAQLLLSLPVAETAWFTREITRLPVDATFRITEPACGYIASYTAVNDPADVGSIKESSGRNTAPQKPLSTYEEEVEAQEQTNVVFTNDEPLYSVNIRKLDALSRNPIEGARLALYSVVSETVAEGEEPEVQEAEYLTLTLKDEFTSTARAKLEKLRPGSYLLRELEAPEGYALTGDIRFDIDASGSATVWNVTTVKETEGEREKVISSGDSVTQIGSLHIDMLDTPYVLTVRKEDVSGQPVRQAYLEIVRIPIVITENENHEDGAESVVAFVTDLTGETVISGQLSADTIYELRELSAPVGYGLADPIRFRLVNSDGTTKLQIYDQNGQSWGEASDTLLLTMVDETEFFFQKAWTDAAGENNLPWQSDIEVEIVRDVKDTMTGNITADSSFALRWTIHRDETGAFTFTPKQECPYAIETYVGEDIGEDIYGFKISDLPRYGDGVEYTYYVRETGPVAGFQEPKYYFGGKKYEERTQSGGTIVNAQVSVALPSTGGPGTTLFTVTGLTLVLLAIALLLLKKEQY